MTIETVSRSIVHFIGHVQGVGFRYQTFQTAKEYEVSGFVQNLPDGRVLMEAEGDAEEVDQFVAAVSDRMSGYVRKLDRFDHKGPRKHQGFMIR
ncbi:MAG TPA: acylphosphatase [Opitutaceae bacterium]